MCRLTSTVRCATHFQKNEQQTATHARQMLIHLKNHKSLGRRRHTVRRSCNGPQAARANSGLSFSQRLAAWAKLGICCFVLSNHTEWMECHFCEKSLRGVIQRCVYGNVDVKNGAQCRFKGLILKIGAQHTKEQVNGLWALTANADDVESVACAQFLAPLLRAKSRGVTTSHWGALLSTRHTHICQNTLVSQLPIVLNTAAAGHELARDPYKDKQ